jgi:hypothetical protein
MLDRFRKTKVACFLLYVEDTANTNISIIIYTYKYVQNMFPKVGLLERLREEKQNTLKHTENCWEHRTDGKGWGRVVEGVRLI